MKPETVAVHSGRRVDRSSGAVSPPINLSTTFERDPDGNYPSGFEYIRDGNPNRNALEECMSALELGAGAVACPSGMAAIGMAFEAAIAARPGRILLPTDMYFGNLSLLAETAFGKDLEVTFVDMTDLSQVEGACSEGNMSLVWIETPSNPLVSVVDIGAVAKIGKSCGALIGCDNTWSTPLLTQPIDHGVDLVVHSLTKYIGGHSDVMGGVVITKEADQVLDEMRAIQRYRGILASPFDSWLALRGAATLPARMRMHCSNAVILAMFLEAHPKVTKVHYPGLSSHPGHAVAARQMKDFGGMLSFEVDGGRKAAMRLTANSQLITRATSLGGNHSLIEHRASIEGTATTAPEGLLRLSVGLEHPDDLCADLDHALGTV